MAWIHKRLRLRRFISFHLKNMLTPTLGLGQWLNLAPKEPDFFWNVIHRSLRYLAVGCSWRLCILVWIICPMSNQLQHFFVIQKYIYHPYLDTLVHCTDFMIHVSLFIYPLHTVLKKSLCRLSLRVDHTSMRCIRTSILSRISTHCLFVTYRFCYLCIVYVCLPLCCGWF